MAKSNKTLVVPASKPRNLVNLNPLMRKGGAFNDTKKGDRRALNADLAQLKNQSALPQDDDTYPNDDYGFGP